MKFYFDHLKLLKLSFKFLQNAILFCSKFQRHQQKYYYLVLQNLKKLGRFPKNKILNKRTALFNILPTFTDPNISNINIYYENAT